MSPGVPDLNYCLSGVDGWVELKVLVRKTRTGKFRLTKLTPEQCAWLARRAAEGGRAFILVQLNQDLLLFPGTAGPALRAGVSWSHLRRLTLLWLTPPLDWSSLRSALREPPS